MLSLIQRKKNFKKNLYFILRELNFVLGQVLQKEELLIIWGLLLLGSVGIYWGLLCAGLSTEWPIHIQMMEALSFHPFSFSFFLFFSFPFLPFSIEPKRVLMKRFRGTKNQARIESPCGIKMHSFILWLLWSNINQLLQLQYKKSRFLLKNISPSHQNYFVCLFF